MPIDTISQVISTIPKAGKRGVDVQTQFVIKQEDFQDHLQGTTVTELNALKTQINTTVTGMNIAVDTVNTKASEASASASSASTSASTATTKASQASTSASSASASSTKAGEWADNNYNIEVEVGKYSAKHWSVVAQNTLASKLDTSAYTASDVLTKLKTVDGAGSGLDADLLDGKHADEFMQTGYCQADLNTMATAGSYKVQTGHLNMPSGVDNGNMLVLRTLTADGFAQIITDYQSNNIYWRSGSAVGWKAWRRILSDGNALTTAPLGYASGAGGSVTQITSKNTAVTLNKICGSIATSNSALAAGATATFIMNNTLIEQYDEITLTPFYGSVLPVNYRIEVYGYGLGIAYIRITNISGGSLSETVTFRFSIKKGAIT